MLSFKVFPIATTLSVFLLGIDAGPLITERWAPSLPTCTNTTDFVYAGCFVDPSSPSALLFRPTDLNNQNMTVEICVDFCKGNGYKYAGLEYYEECFCGASVGGPQTAESNCSFPCTGNKNESCGGNDIISVYQDTTFPTVDDTTISDYIPMGCYSDLGPNGRTLAWKQDQIPNADLTIESCLNACKEGGYPFAGVEYSQECYCGVVLGNGTAKVDEANCQMPCNGNARELCGGAANLYLYVAEDLLSTDPCNGNPGGTVSSSISSYSSTSSSSASPASSTIYTTTSSTLSSSSSSSPSSSSSLSSDTSSSAAVSTNAYSPPPYVPPPYTPPPYTPLPYSSPPASSTSFSSTPVSPYSSYSSIPSSSSYSSSPISLSSSYPSAPASSSSSSSSSSSPSSPAAFSTSFITPSSSSAYPSSSAPFSTYSSAPGSSSSYSSTPASSSSSSYSSAPASSSSYSSTPASSPSSSSSSSYASSPASSSSYSPASTSSSPSSYPSSPTSPSSSSISSSSSSAPSILPSTPSAAPSSSSSSETSASASSTSTPISLPSSSSPYYSPPATSSSYSLAPVSSSSAAPSISSTPGPTPSASSSSSIPPAPPSPSSSTAAPTSPAFSSSTISSTISSIPPPTSTLYPSSPPTSTLSSSSLSSAAPTSSTTPYSPPTTTQSSPTSVSSSPLTSSSAKPSTTPISHTKSSAKPLTTPSPTTSKPSATLCTSITSTTPTSNCEYKVGNWCSKPLPPYSDQTSCLAASSTCLIQLTSCLLSAGFPASLECLDFSSWCQQISNYCLSYCPGPSCSNTGYNSRYPPPGYTLPTISTKASIYACPTTIQTTSKPTTTTTTTTPIAPLPTCRNICAQPNNPSKGYGSYSPVGSIPLPCYTCNNLQPEYSSGYPFKLYTAQDSANSPRYSRPNCGQGCQDACEAQYTGCVETYARSCLDGGVQGDTYEGALVKCEAQKADCYVINEGVSGGGRCTSYDSGY